MRLLSMCISAALAAVFFAPLAARSASAERSAEFDLDGGYAPAAIDVERAFEELPRPPVCGPATSGVSRIVVDVDLVASPGFSLESVGDRREARYRMAFNNIAEGWNWQPLADPQQEDYYRAKFLPLRSVTVERGEYDGQDKIGVVQRVKVSWRYDYFLSFDNPDDFYPRGGGDDAGFVAPLPPEVAGKKGDVRMLAIARLSEPCVSESTTFWKAMYSTPVDYTLKKRYLHGRLETILYYDGGDRRILGRLDRR